MIWGRKRLQDPKSEHIRISLRTRRELFELGRILKMPLYYNEGDIIDGLVHIVKSALTDN